MALTRVSSCSSTGENSYLFGNGPIQGWSELFSSLWTWSSFIASEKSGNTNSQLTSFEISK